MEGEEGMSPTPGKGPRGFGGQKERVGDPRTPSSADGFYFFYRSLISDFAFRN
jgi:hypothetical protein